MKVLAATVHPSQDFLKEDTIKHIFRCLRDGRLDKLPPTPIVRLDNKGNLIAIDGHNLIAVRAFLGELVEVFVATSSKDGLPETSSANIERNRELRHRYKAALLDNNRINKEGITSFADLLTKYQMLFAEEQGHRSAERTLRLGAKVRIRLTEVKCLCFRLG